MLGYGVALALTLVVLLYLGWRGRRMTDASRREVPDRSVVGEAATAIEDVAADIIGPARGRGVNAGNRSRPDSRLG